MITQEYAADLIRIARLRRKRKSKQKRQVCKCNNYLLNESHNYMVCIHCVIKRFLTIKRKAFTAGGLNKYQTQYNLIGNVSDIVLRHFGNPNLGMYTNKALGNVSYKDKKATFASLDGIFWLLRYANRDAYSIKYRKLLIEHLRELHQYDRFDYDHIVIKIFTKNKTRQELATYLKAFEIENNILI